MRRLAVFVAIILLAPSGSLYFWLNQHGGLASVTQLGVASGTTNVVGVPPQGKLYHGIYPGGVSGEEDDITPMNLSSYEQLAGKSVAWVYFSDNWYKGRSFPIQTATWVRNAGSVPFIRLMLRSSAQQNISEPTFTLTRIINGDFDSDLRAWARAARNFSSPLLVEWGTEVNGIWFSWNGYWNGGATLGPQRFRDAYCHIVQLMRNESANNIVWVFHANNNDNPNEPWNRLENYYPGDKCVDWIGVSVYGPTSPMDNETRQFRDLMDQVYPRLAALNATKPIVLLEFGASSGNPQVDQAAWTGSALANLTSFRWSRLIGFSYWNEPPFRLQDNPTLANVFRSYVGQNSNVLGSAVIVGPSVITTTASQVTTSMSVTSTSQVKSTSTTSSSVTRISSASLISSSQTSTPTATTAASSTTVSTTSTFAPTGGGGIPEFPAQFLITVIFAVLIVASYLFRSQRNSV